MRSSIGASVLEDASLEGYSSRLLMVLALLRRTWRPCKILRYAGADSGFALPAPGAPKKRPATLSATGLNDTHLRNQCLEDGARIAQHASCLPCSISRMQRAYVNWIK